MKKRILALLLCVVMVFALTACASSSNNDVETTANSETTATAGIPASELKIGFIFVGDENEGYTAAHYNAALEVQNKLGLSDDQIIVKWNVPESEECYDAAIDLADQGCNIIIANSFGHEDFIMQVAEQYPEIQFCHATGYQAANSGMSNLHNFFTAVYESRYVSGVVAGMKLNEMIENGDITAEEAKVGYVGAYPYAEVISGFTSFFLGVRSVCPEAVMEVTYVNSWADFAAEMDAAYSLIADNCVLISQHSDTTGPATACQDKGVPIVGYNISMIEAAPDYALTSASINWAPYYTYAVESVVNGTEIVADWCQGYAEGADCITELNASAVAEGTAEKVAEVETAIINGSLHVFDTATWTVNGETLTTYSENGNEYISDGYFHESEFASAPAFSIMIDGITTK